MDYIGLMKHCIGLDRKRPYTRHGQKFYRPYRNYYFTGKSQNGWEELTLAGYAKRGEKNSHGGYIYWLTRAWLDYLGEKMGVKILDEESD